MADETLRETLEAAYEEVGTSTPAPAASEEAGRSTQDAPEPVRDTAPTERQAAEPKPTAEPSGGRQRGPDGKFLRKTDEPQPAVTASEPATAIPEPTPEPTPAEARPSVRAPESWKPAAREHWMKLPPDVQQEVARREREITSTLQQTASQRKLAEHFTESIRPFEAMIRAENRDPVTAATELFATAAMLRTGTPVQKAKLVANMVKNFGIPIEALDAELVGEEVPDETSRLSQLLDQRLKPMQDFIAQIQGVRQQREQTVSQSVKSEIEQFAEDPNNEFFADVRETMADLMEVASRRNRELSLADAYKQAVALNPELQAIIAKRKADEIRDKEIASASLPSGSAPQRAVTGSGTLRDDLERAFATVANR